MPRGDREIQIAPQEHVDVVPSFDGVGRSGNVGDVDQWATRSA